MRAGTFTWVLLLSAALAGAAWFFLGREAPAPDLQGKLLFPDLRAVLTGAREIETTTNEQTFTLQSGESGGWTVRERDDYPAQASTVRRFLLGVAGLKIRSRKTSNPDLYAKLDLNEPEEDDSKAMRVVIRNEDGDDMAAFLAGRIRPASEVDNPDPDRGESELRNINQIFVRLPDAPTVWLVEGALDIAREPVDYINRDALTDTARDQIRSVTVAHPQADDVSVTRAAQGDDFALQNIPDGQQLKNQFQLNDLVDLFVNLKFEDVTAADAVDWNDGLSATMTTFKKLQVVIEQSGDETAGESWVRLRAEPPADAAEDSAEATRANELNKRWDGWAYRLPDFRMETLTRTMDALVEEADADGDGDGGGASDG